MKKGSKMTLEQRKRVSEGHRGIGKGKRKPHTEEAKKKMGLANIGKTPWNKGGGEYSEEYKKKRSESQKTLWSNQEYRKKMSEVHKGFKVTEITKQKLRVINTGKKMSPEAIKKFVESRKRNDNYKHTDESKRKLSIAGKGRPAWNKGASFPEESERNEWQKKVSRLSKERLLKLYESGAFPLQENTLIERKIKRELKKRGYKEGTDFIHQYKFMNKFMCDFCFPKQKVIVEVDGDFWHANPKKYSDKNKLHPHQIKGIKRDKSKNAYIGKVDDGSWKMVRLWESEINEDVSKCVDKIEEALSQ